MDWSKWSAIRHVRFSVSPLPAAPGASFSPMPCRIRADVLLTGEMRFHDYLTAEAEGLSVLLPGHYASERPGVEVLAERLQQQWPDVTVWASRCERDPVTWV